MLCRTKCEPKLYMLWQKMAFSWHSQHNFCCTFQNLCAYTCCFQSLARERFWSTAQVRPYLDLSLVPCAHRCDILGVTPFHHADQWETYSRAHRAARYTFVKERITFFQSIQFSHFSVTTLQVCLLFGALPTHYRLLENYVRPQFGIWGGKVIQVNNF